MWEFFVLVLHLCCKTEISLEHNCVNKRRNFQNKLDWYLKFFLTKDSRIKRYHLLFLFLYNFEHIEYKLQK